MELSGLKRITTDKFYTSIECVKNCIAYINQYIDIDYDNDIIIEPSAGNGAFISDIQQLCKNNLFYDILPEHELIIPQDYLNLDTNIITQENYKSIHIIGNPPFGRQSSYAIQFIKKSASFCNTISFILPKSFKKQSLQKYFPLSFHLLYEYEIEDNSFLLNDKEYNVPCVFQIWIKKDFNRKVIEKLIPNNYVFVKKDEQPDISFRRVGVYASNIDINITDKSIQSHYFIKFTNLKSEKHKEEIIDKLKKIKFNTNNTVGPKSISKQEIIEEFNKIL